MITVKDITKKFGKKTVLSGASFSLERGEIGCMVGINGSGKSTLLSIIAGVLTMDSGIVEIASTKPIGFLPQNDFLFPALSVVDNLEFWASAVNVKKGSKEFLETIELFSLNEFTTAKVGQLSGGMRRRTALATVMLGEPDCIILDEPFTGLDILSKQDVGDYFPLLSGLGRTLLYSSHNWEEIEGIADRLFTVKNGYVEELALPILEGKLANILLENLKEKREYE